MTDSEKMDKVMRELQRMHETVTGLRTALDAVTKSLKDEDKKIKKVMEDINKLISQSGQTDKQFRLLKHRVAVTESSIALVKK